MPKDKKCMHEERTKRTKGQYYITVNIITQSLSLHYNLSITETIKTVRLVIVQHTIS